jgi:hypothetical protein
MISIGTRGDSDLESTSKVSHLLDSIPLPRVSSFLTSSRSPRCCQEHGVPAAPFTLPATDSGCGVNVTMYRIDGGNWTVYTGGFTLTEGEHTIYYYSIGL